MSKNVFPDLLLIAFTFFSPCFLIAFVYFSNSLPKEEYANLACSIICLLLKGNNSFINKAIRHSYLSIFASNNPDIFAASPLRLYCSVTSLILLSFVLISFYILSKRFFLKRKDLSDTFNV